MFRERARAFQGLWLTLDVACIALAFGAALLLRVAHDSIPLLQRIPSIPLAAENAVRSDYAALFLTSLVAWVWSLKRAGLHMIQRPRRSSAMLWAHVKAMALAGLVTAAVVFGLKMHSLSRLFFAYYFGASFVLLVSKELLLASVLQSLHRAGLVRRHALVIGAGRPASWLAQVVGDAEEHGYELVGMLLTRKVISRETLSVPVLGGVDDLDRTLTQYPVDEVFIVGGASELAGLAPVAEGLIKRGRVVSLVTPLASSVDGIRGRITEFSGVPMISFGPMSKDEVGLTLKRAVDVIVSSAAMVLLAPLALAVAAAVKLFDPGPVLFAQERLGRAGHRFRLYKFRSMRTDAEALLKSDEALYRRYLANDYKLPENEDPRISRLGRFLRKSSLDELPQLWNVLRGDMTLVGPRPIVPAEVEMYEPYTDLLFSVQPGVTGHWQVAGRSDVQYPERAFMDFDYIGNSSFFGDLSILARTLPAVLMRKGAH